MNDKILVDRTLLQKTVDALVYTEMYLRIEVNEAYGRDAHVSNIRKSEGQLAHHHETIATLRSVLDVPVVPTRNNVGDASNLAAVIITLCDEVERLRVDAARYQWLRDTGDETWVPLKTRWLDGMYTTQAEAHIDAAIAAMDVQKRTKPNDNH